MKSQNRICVLGGSGTMGQVIVTCLLRQNRSLQVLIADRQTPKTKYSSRVRFKPVNLLKHQELVKVIRGNKVVINSTSHHFNLPVMKAALEARVHYIDLGGLFHFTRRQLKLHSLFKKKNLTAILGMGCAPGVSNLLAKWASEEFEKVDEIHIKVGGRSWGTPEQLIPYAIGTVREELTLKPAIFYKGRFCFPPPMSGKERFLFPKPVGRQLIFRTLHSETATLPFNLKAKEASFKIGFSEEVIDAVLGHPLKKKRLSKNKQKYRDCEITVAVVTGKIKNKKRSCFASYEAQSSEGHSAGDWDTAWPPAIVADFVARGVIQESGVFAPEQIVPFPDFFKNLKRAGFKLKCY